MLLEDTKLKLDLQGLKFNKKVWYILQVKLWISTPHKCNFLIDCSNLCLTDSKYNSIRKYFFKIRSFIKTLHFYSVTLYQYISIRKLVEKLELVFIINFQVWKNLFDRVLRSLSVQKLQFFYYLFSIRFICCQSFRRYNSYWGRFFFSCFVVWIWKENDLK